MVVVRRLARHFFIDWFQRQPSSRRAFSLRPVAIFLCLLALMIQGYVVQTHVHQAAGLQLIDLNTPDSPKAPQGEDPLGDDSANCPFCQEMMQVGNFILPVAPILSPPILVNSDIVTFPEMIPVSGESHSWRGRGPPRA